MILTLTTDLLDDMLQLPVAESTLVIRRSITYSVFESFDDNAAPRIAAAPSLPNGPITQLSPYFTRKPGMGNGVCKGAPF